MKKLKIGNVELENRYLLGPMAGVTDLPFRLLCKEQGAGLLGMEMVSAKAILYSAFGGDFLEGSFAGEGPEEIFVAFSECTSDLVGFIGAGSRKGCLLERFGTGKA